MAINQTFSVAPELIAPYAYQTGHATGSKQNVMATLEAAQRSAEMAQRARLAQMEMAQRQGLAQMELQNSREARYAQLYGNSQDNERMLQQSQIEAEARLRQEQMQQQAYDDRATMEADLRLRNDTMTRGGGNGIHIPDVTQGPAQNYDIALANQDVFRSIAGRDRNSLLQKFQTGDPQAIDAALNSGRARLGEEESKALNQLNSQMMKSFEDTTLRPQMRAALQAQLAQKIAAIKARAQWLPDEQQPKDLQEQMQDRVLTITNPAGEKVFGIAGPKGEFVPWHELTPEAKPDPNRPKPIDPQRVREQHERAYDAAYKALVKVDPVSGVATPPSDADVASYLHRRRAAVDAVLGGQQPQQEQGVAQSVVGMLRGMFGGEQQQPASQPSPQQSPTPPTPQPPAAPQRPSVIDMLPPPQNQQQAMKGTAVSIAVNAGEKFMGLDSVYSAMAEVVAAHKQFGWDLPPEIEKQIKPKLDFLTNLHNTESMPLLYTPGSEKNLKPGAVYRFKTKDGKDVAGIWEGDGMEIIATYSRNEK